MKEINFSQFSLTMKETFLCVTAVQHHWQTLHIPVQNPRTPFLTASEWVPAQATGCPAVSGSASRGLGSLARPDLSPCRLFKHTELIQVLNVVVSVQADP